MGSEAGRSGPWPYGTFALLGALAAWPFFSARADDPREFPYPHSDYQVDCNLCHADERWQAGRRSSARTRC